MKSNISQNIILFLSALLLIIAPLFRAANRPLPLLILEVLGLGLLLTILWNNEYKGKIPIYIWGLLLIIIIAPALYLIPLPESFTSLLSNRELYQSVLQWVATNSSVDIPRQTLSLIPEKTIDSLLTLIPIFAIFVATMSLTTDKAKRLVYIFLGMVAIEVIIAIAQFTNGSDTLYFGMKNAHNAQGTYPNRDHFAGLIEMSLPLTIALLAISFSPKNKKYQADDLFMRLASHETLILASLAVLMLLAAIFSKSRTGIFLVLLGILISSLSFARHIGGRQSIGVMASLSTVGLGIAFSVGIIPVINRFIANDPLEDGRKEIFNHTIEAIKQFYPLGTGVGTFPNVYRAFQPIEQPHFINNAHNDYLELFLEMGVVGALLLCAFFIIYLIAWTKVLRTAWLRFRYIQMGAGIGMFLLLLHGFSDFNFHIPANVIFFAFLAGLFFHQPEKDKPVHEHIRRSKRRMKNPIGERSGMLHASKEIKKDRKKNPFSN